jgi:hypothetical protein
MAIAIGSALCGCTAVSGPNQGAGAQTASNAAGAVRYPPAPSPRELARREREEVVAEEKKALLTGQTTASVPRSALAGR